MSTGATAGGAVGRLATLTTLSFAQKVLLLPSVAGVALLLVLAITAALGRSNERRLTSIHKGFYPSAQSSRALQQLLTETQRGLQDAVAARDLEQLAAADSLSRSFTSALAAGRSNPVADRAALDSLAVDFEAYYALARSTTERLIAGDNGEQVFQAMQAMHQRHVGVKERLEARVASDMAQIDAAFTAAAALQRRTRMLVALVAGCAIAALVGLAAVAVRSLTGPMAEAVHVADRLAEGDTSVTISPRTNDEIGRLLLAMQRMVAYMGEMGDAAGAMARGDLSRRVTPRSPADAFGQAFGAMTDYLREMAGVAQQIAQGDVTASVTPRSADDTFGQAFAMMTGYLTEMADVARRISAGDVAVKVTPRTANDAFGSSFVAMAETLSQVAGSLRGSSLALSAAAAQVAGSAQALSGGTREEETAVRTTLAHLDQVGALVSRTVEQGVVVREITENGARAVADGGAAMRDVVTMTNEILDRVRVIDDIATHTDVLALNALLEAARAGQHGKGFAIVAHEMRSLSERSQGAAESVRELVARSRAVTERSGAGLVDLVASMEQTMRVMQELSAAAAAQSAGLGDVDAALRQVSAVTGQNSAAAEDLAATSQEMAAQAESLEGLVKFFRLDDAGALHELEAAVA